MDRKKGMFLQGIKSRWNYIFLLIVMGNIAFAQDTYQYELGFGAGLSSYTGDLSRNMIMPLGKDFNIFLRSNKSSRLSYCIEYNNGEASGTSEDLDILFPEVKDVQDLIDLSFSTKYQSLDVLLETNFFPYPKQKTLVNSSDITPFYFFGVGVKQYSGTAKGNAFSVPLGLGLKWKVNETIAIQYRCKIEKLLTDDFDGVNLNDPYLFKDAIDVHRQDFLYMNTFSLVFSFGQTKWDCNCQKDQRRKKDNHAL